MFHGMYNCGKNYFSFESNCEKCHLTRSASLETRKNYCYEECLTFHNNINISLNFHGIKLFSLAKPEKMCTWAKFEGKRMGKDTELIIYVHRVSWILSRFIGRQSSEPTRVNKILAHS